MEHSAHSHTGHSHAGHSHAGHSHGASAASDGRKLGIALGLILGLMVVEVVFGLLAHSLALLSDAGHMLTDAAALGLSLVALRVARRPAKGAMTYGFRRVEILSAQANGVTLLVLALLIVEAAIHRLFDPPHVRAGLILAVALIGAGVNLLATWTLAKANRESLNMEGSFQHLLTDLYAFLATAVAAGVILVSGFQRADPIASLLVAALMLRSSYGLIKACSRVFLEAAPVGLDVDAIGNAMIGLAGVVEVHDLHVWEVTSSFPALSAHVLVTAQANCHAARRDLEALLHERFQLTHTTLQVDHEGNDLITLEPLQPAAAERR
jgi:cobalt-zinc-cadmium efflux system protein